MYQRICEEIKMEKYEKRTACFLHDMNKDRLHSTSQKLLYFSFTLQFVQENLGSRFVIEIIT